MAAGPGIRSGQALPEASILDLAPTILHLLGEAVPRVMDGRVLMEALVNPTPVRFSEDGAIDAVAEQGFKEDEVDQIKERLRGLGYL
jgi:hypothetical protein